MKKPFLTLLSLLLALATASAFMRFTPDQKLKFAEEAIAKFYVDTINEEKLVEDAIIGMLDKLDPHSAYSTAEETKQMNEPLDGKFSGIGITYNLNQDTVYVLQTVAGGPSEKVGILPGDRILSVNDTLIAGQKFKTTDIAKRLRGPKGTKANLKVLRRASGSNDTIIFRVTRDEIPINSIDAAYIVEPGIGYIRLARFGATTPKEFTDALAKLKKEGMNSLILDLSDNGGGYLQPAVELVSELVPEGFEVVYTEGNASPRYDYRAKAAGKSPLFQNGRVVVMVNQNTASAAEIAAGAIQDWDRGVVVGRRSFGKGLVQRPIPFPDGSMIRLTVAHYFTPAGRNIQKPYVNGDKKAYADDLNERLKSGELMHADSVKLVDSLMVKSLRTGRELYGGGGINPDRFVPLDTMANTKYYRNLMAKGIPVNIAIAYVEKNRKQIKSKYRTDDQFVQSFVVPQELMDQLRTEGDREGVEYNAEQAEKSRELLAMMLKALIGRDIYDSPTYYKVYNRYDPLFGEALKLIKSPEYESILRSPVNPHSR